MLYVLTWRCIVPSPPPNTSPKLHFYIKHFPIQKILSFNPEWSHLSKVQFYLEELEIYRSIHYSVPLLLYIVSNSVPGGAVYQGMGFRLRSWTYQFSHFKQSNCFLPCRLPASERWCSLSWLMWVPWHILSGYQTHVYKLPKLLSYILCVAIIIKSCVHLLLRQSQTQRFERFREHCRKCQHRLGGHCSADIEQPGDINQCPVQQLARDQPPNLAHLYNPRSGAAGAGPGRARRGGAGRCLISRLPGRPLNNCARHEARYCILPSCAHHSCSTVCKFLAMARNINSCLYLEGLPWHM